MQKSPHLKNKDGSLRFGKHEEIVIRREGAVEAVRKELTDRNGRPKFSDRLDRRVIYASPLVDVAANMELVKETISICKTILELTHWDIRLLSKSNLLPKVAEGLLGATDSHAEMVRARMIFGVSTGTLDNNLAKAFEQGTPLVSKRIESLHWLQDNGFRTFGMICPSLPQAHFHPNNYKLFAEEMAAAIRAEKCEHIWAECINARGESMLRTEKALHDAGFHSEAERFHTVSTVQDIWEHGYARHTFNAHAEVYRGMTGPDGTPKLRFLQYVTKATRDWWAARKNEGAILL